MKKRVKTDQFLDLYNQYVDGVFRFCFYKTSDRNVALDITQEVFTNIWQYLKKGGKIDNEKAFVYSTSNRKVIDWYRAKKPSVSLESLHEAGFDFKADVVDQSIQIDGEQAIAKVKELDEIYRDVLLLRYVEDLSVKEIAVILNETENNVSVRIHRGMDKLREIYEKEENKNESR